MESESDPLTRRAVDLFEKKPLKGNSEVHLHTPTKFGEDRSKDLGGDREQTDRQADKRCSIYSMMYCSVVAAVVTVTDVMRVTVVTIILWSLRHRVTVSVQKLLHIVFVAFPHHMPRLSIFMTSALNLSVSPTCIQPMIMSTLC